MKFREILNRWPSIEVLSMDLNEKYATVLRWRSRGSIPSDCWDKLIVSARKRKIKLTAMELVQAAAKPERIE